jgi:hypothetical protein
MFVSTDTIWIEMCGSQDALKLESRVACNSTRSFVLNGVKQLDPNDAELERPLHDRVNGSGSDSLPTHPRSDSVPNGGERVVVVEREQRDVADESAGLGDDGERRMLSARPVRSSRAPSLSGGDVEYIWCLVPQRHLGIPKQLKSLNGIAGPRDTKDKARRVQLSWLGNPHGSRS